MSEWPSSMTRITMVLRLTKWVKFVVVWLFGSPPPIVLMYNMLLKPIGGCYGTQAIGFAWFFLLEPGLP